MNRFLGQSKLAIQQAARWSGLREIGNFKLVKATILVPIIGYMILFNDELVKYFNLAPQFLSADSVFTLLLEKAGATPPEINPNYRLYSFYFGFTFLGVASVLFHMVFPPMVRIHGSAWQFVEREEKTILPGRRHEMANEIVRREMQSQGLALDIDRITQLSQRSEYAKSDETNDEKHWAKRFSDLCKMAPTHLMTQWFLPLKDTNPTARWIILLLYSTGFLVVAIPALDTFAIVIITLLKG